MNEWIERSSQSAAQKEELKKIIISGASKEVYALPTYGAMLKRIQEKKKFGEIFKLTQAIEGNGCSDIDAIKMDEEFAELTTMQPHYGSTTPTLSFGSIVRNKKNEYFICITPVCDTVRVDKDTPKNFVFLKCDESPDEFDFIVRKNSADSLKFQISLSVSDVMSLSFKGDSISQLVTAKKHINSNQWFFTSSEPRKGQRWYWIADLKFAHAVRVAHRFSTGMTRIGLTESEWIRRASKK